MGGEAIAYHGMRGYWLVRYLEENHPGFLKRMFSLHRDPKMIEQEMMVELGISNSRFGVVYQLSALHISPSGGIQQEPAVQECRKRDCRLAF